MLARQTIGSARQGKIRLPVRYSTDPFVMRLDVAGTGQQTHNRCQDR